MTVIERFKEAIIYLKNNKIEIKKQDIATKLDISAQTFTEILGERMKFTLEIMEKFCDLYNISADWLLTGKGEMLRDSTPYIYSNVGNNYQNNVNGDNSINSGEMVSAINKLADAVKLMAEKMQDKN